METAESWKQTHTCTHTLYTQLQKIHRSIGIHTQNFLRGPSLKLKKTSVIEKKLTFIIYYMSGIILSALNRCSQLILTTPQGKYYCSLFY